MACERLELLQWGELRGTITKQICIFSCSLGWSELQEIHTTVLFYTPLEDWFPWHSWTNQCWAQVPWYHGQSDLIKVWINAFNLACWKWLGHRQCTNYFLSIWITKGKKTWKVNIIHTLKNGKVKMAGDWNHANVKICCKANRYSFNIFLDYHND